MTEQPGRSDASPLGSVPPEPSAAEPAADARFGQTTRLAGHTARSSRKSNGLSARGLYTMAAASLLLGIAGFTYLAEQIQHVQSRVDTVTTELRAEIRASEERQEASVAALAVELRAEIRASEARQKASIAALADRVSGIEVLLADIKARLEALERAYLRSDARLTRLETSVGLPPLPLAQSGTTATAAVG